MCVRMYAQELPNLHLSHYVFFASKCIQKMAGGAHSYLDVGGQGDFKLNPC